MPAVKKPKTQKNPIARPLETHTKSNSNNVISGQLKKKIIKKQKKLRDERGVVIIKHLPHGFFEEQLRKYFQQFGRVTRVRLARSKRTGGSKGFAFVEFEYPEVAKVAAETMDNYLMFKKVVKASYIPPNEQKFNYFKTSVQKVKNKAGKEIYISSKTAAINRRVKAQNDWNDEAYQKRTEAGLKKLKKVQNKFKHLNLDLSSLVVEPKKVITAETADAKGKRKTGASEVKTEKKSKKKIKLEDLLGNTLNDDSDDNEDYVASESDESDEDEESASDMVSDHDDDDSLDEEEELQQQNAIKVKQKGVKELASAGDRFESLIKRKSHSGGIQKYSKKGLNQPTVAKATKSLQIAAAKKMAKPLKYVKKTAKVTSVTAKGKKVKK